jgi:hypothetical protein
LKSGLTEDCFGRCQKWEKNTRNWSTVDIHESTLRERLELNVTSGPKMGRKAVFTDGQEHELGNHLLQLPSFFHWVTLTELQRILYDFAGRNSLKHKFNHEIQLAAQAWEQGLLGRNKELLGSLNLLHLAGSRVHVTRFHDNLVAVFETYKFSLNHTFNVDASRFSCVQKPSVISCQGHKLPGIA